MAVFVGRISAGAMPWWHGFKLVAFDERHLLIPFSDRVFPVERCRAGRTAGALPVVHCRFVRPKTFPIITLIGNYLAARA